LPAASRVNVAAGSIPSLPPVKLCTTFSVLAAQALFTRNTATAATTKTFFTDTLLVLLPIFSSPKNPFDLITK
jgi:hypothetical protein